VYAGRVGNALTHVKDEKIKSYALMGIELG
jgi:hypothetical protein